MLIRNQDKKALFNIDNTAAFNVFGTEKGYGVEAECLDYSYTIGHYSTEEKALKALDMIQEAYARYEIIKASLSDIANMAKEAPDTPESKEIIAAIGKRIIKDMTFQMPEDDEVEA